MAAHAPNLSFLLLFRDNREDFLRVFTFKLCLVIVCVEPPGLLVDCRQQFRKVSFVLATRKVLVKQ